jgi:hypothetical protein
MKKQSRYREASIAPQRFTYEVATIGNGGLSHAMVKTRAVCGQVTQDRSLHYTRKAVSCRRCAQRLAAHPHTYVRSIPSPPSVAAENLRVILMMLEELGGSTTLLAKSTPEVLAERLAALEPWLSTHVIIIGVVPLDTSAFYETM